MVSHPGYWTQRGRWYVPQVSPVLDESTLPLWRAYGTLIVLYVITLGTGPDPVSPFLVYLLLAQASYGQSRPLADSDLELSLEFVNQLDDKLAEEIAPWMCLDHTTNLHQGNFGPTSPLVQFLCGCGQGYQVCS
jgi:hypothetical protein